MLNNSSENNPLFSKKDFKDFLQIKKQGGGPNQTKIQKAV